MLFVLCIIGITSACTKKQISEDEKFLTYIVDAQSQDIAFYWKNDSGNIIRSIERLKTYVESRNKELVFAVNGGMYNKERAPQGLFIQNGKVVTPLDTTQGKGNFYMKPNGVFYITNDNEPIVCRTEDFKDNGQVKYATQSGPMLLDDGKMHPAFKEGSENLNIRNGVGIMADGRVVFVMSKAEVNFYDFASYFMSLGCKDALYLDGYVSRTYLPGQDWIQIDGDFGVIIGVVK